MQSASAVLPHVGNTQPLPGSPNANAGGSPWAYPPPPSLDPYSPQLSSYWNEINWNPTPGHLATQRRESFGPLTSSSTLPNWSTLQSSGGSLLTPPIASAAWGRQQSSGSPKFDAQDRLSLGDGWFLIRGENAFFLEHADSGLDIPIHLISTSNG